MNLEIYSKFIGFLYYVFLFFITNLIKKNTGGVENTGAIKGAIISFILKVLTKKIIIPILRIYSKI